MAGLEGRTEGSSSRCVRFNSVRSLSWSLIKPLPGWKNWSNLHIQASSLRLNPATMARRLSPTCLASLDFRSRSEEHTSELQSHLNLVCRLLLEKKKNHDHVTNDYDHNHIIHR